MGDPTTRAPERPDKSRNGLNKRDISAGLGGGEGGLGDVLKMVSAREPGRIKLLKSLSKRFTEQLRNGGR